MELKSPRSILCVPGHKADLAAKCRNYGADQILWDLEDSVPSGMKEKAREVVDQHLSEGDAIRINPPGSQFYDRDMEFVNMWPGLVWIPKCQDASPLLAVLDRRRSLGAPNEVPQVALLESPGAVVALSNFRAYSYAWAGGLAFGKHDFLAAAGLSPWQSAAVDHAAAQVALAAMARGVPCWMAPSYELDPVLVLDDAEHALDLGFSGMGCIRPAQVEIVNHVFRPCDEDVARAGLLIAAAEARPDEAVFRTPDGDLVSPPTLARARKVLNG